MVRAVRGLGVFWGLRDDRRRWNTGGEGDGTRRCGAHTVRSSSGPVPRRRPLPAPAAGSPPVLAAVALPSGARSAL